MSFCLDIETLCLANFVKLVVGSGSDEFLVFHCVRIEFCVPALRHSTEINNNVSSEHKSTESLHLQFVLVRWRGRLNLKPSSVIVRYAGIRFSTRSHIFRRP